MSDYTPDTEDVRGYYGIGRDEADGAVDHVASYAEFDRWLAKNNAQVAAKALRDAAADARARGDIGHPEGVPAERWLNGLAKRIEEDA